MTSVSNLSTFLIRKALPDGAVYSSEETPPKGTTIFYTDAGTAYWMREPQDQVFGDKITDAANKLISEATADYNAQYNKTFIEMQVDFEARLKDPESKEFRQMRNLVSLLIHPDYDDEDEDISSKTVEELLQSLGHSEEGNKGTVNFSSQAGFIDKYAEEGSGVSDGTAIQKMNPLVRYRVLQALMGSRYPGNDGVEIPTHHFRALTNSTNGITVNGNRKYSINHSNMAELYKHVMGLKKADGYNPKVIAMLKTEVKKFKRVIAYSGKLSSSFKAEGTITNALLYDIFKKLGGSSGGETYGQCSSTSKEYYIDQETGKTVFPHHPDGSRMIQVTGIELYNGSHVHDPDALPRNQRSSTTVLHEMSHAVHMNLPRHIQNRIKKEYVRAMDENAGFPTVYSKAGGQEMEFFAECYAAYVAHTKIFKQRNPTMFELMKELFEKKPKYFSREDFDSDTAFMDWQSSQEQLSNSLNQKMWSHRNKGNHYKPLNEQEFWPQSAAKSIEKALLEKANEDVGDTKDDNDIRKTFDAVRDGLSMSEISEKLGEGHDIELTDKKDIVGIVVPDGKDLPPADDDEELEKSWYTNPRGDKDPFAANALVVALDNRKGYKSIRKEGDGGGGFGDGGGTAFTSTDSGIFTPTHSERERQPKKEKRTGVHRLADFLTDNSPERKMEKGDTTITTLVNLINWVKMEMRKDDKKHFRQQTSGETINSQPPRIDWARGNKEMPREDGQSEFDGKPDPNAAISQKDEERRIRRLVSAEDKTANAPANGDLRLRWESGGYQSDALHQGSAKDKEQGDVEDPEDKNVDNPFEEEDFESKNYPFAEEEDFESKNDKAFTKLLKEIEEF